MSVPALSAEAARVEQFLGMLAADEADLATRLWRVRTMIDRQTALRAALADALQKRRSR